MTARDGQLPVSDIFFSIQGEGVHAGLPAVFLRLSYCNLTCVWCDSKFTWQSPVEADWTTPADLIARLAKYPSRRLVLTGGEPLLWQKPLVQFLESPAFDSVEVETNGTMVPTSEFDACVALYHVSPKLANSGVPPDKRIVPPALRWFSGSPKAIFKYVVTDLRDLEEVRAQVKRFKIPPSRVLIMPEAALRDGLLARFDAVAEAARDAGFGITDRLHLRLWDSTRAV
ncbi:MAG: 7-carboxy-7-deazaguanine synthase QueE [bacterium]